MQDIKVLMRSMVCAFATGDVSNVDSLVAETYLDHQGELLMANPFSAVPTPYRVEADERSWYANCAWDAIGICAALHADGQIETTCPDCGEPIRLRIENGRPDDESLVFHCLVPARQWWDDIVFT